MSIAKWITSDGSDKAKSLGILLLRVLVGISLFLNHGLEKLTGYSTMVGQFPDPFHITAHASLAYALLSDSICSVLVMIGFATRLSSLVILWNVIVAFVVVHHATFTSNTHAERAWAYICVYAALSLAGAGGFSVDAWLNRRAGSKSR
jgi:putative oxidoreductase